MDLFKKMSKVKKGVPLDIGSPRRKNSITDPSIFSNFMQLGQSSPVISQSVDIHKLAREGNLPELQKLSKQLPILLEALNSSGQTPLHAAAEGIGKTSDVLRLFISASPSLNLDIPDKQGCAPLHCAIYGAAFEAAKVLLENGADPNCCLLYTSPSPRD
eukprot:TRINITY_DN8652_c0_g1_i1.p1 TRINITY_DN8652_c0_g1~~TRINITY_DN8652_c0_g1_i1.p1  ORF type:complete len:159 (-),score=17.73 TRINITY_DN8652_c0_g1_i1:24-500(-)